MPCLESEMLDVAQFEAKFTDWRGATTALDEHIFLHTAKLIGEYVNTHTFRTISLDLLDDSATFESFNEHHVTNLRVRLYGAAVYIKFAIDDYLRDEAVGEQEQEVLGNLSKQIGLIYGSSFPIRHLYRVLSIREQISTWLQTDAATHTNKAKAKDLCISIYVVLKIALFHGVEANLLSEEQQSTLQEYINFAETKIEAIEEAAPVDQIEGLEQDVEVELDNASGDEFFDPLNNADPQGEELGESSDDEYEDALVAPDIQEAVPPEPPRPPALRSPLAVAPATLRAYFDEQYLAILSTDGPSLRENIGRIKASLEEKNRRIVTLNGQKQVEDDLNTLFHDAQKIINKITKNITQHERSTALELIEAHRAHIEFFRVSVPELCRVEWDFQEAGARQVVARSKAWLSKITTRIINSAQGTTDTSHKQAIIQLANNYLLTLRSPPPKKGKIDRLQDEIDETINLLAGDSRTAARLLKGSTSHNLTALISENESMIRVLNDFEPFIARIEENQRRLRELTGLNSNLDAFIADYDGFFVKLSILLSYYISSIFKTNTADKIEKARTMVREVKGWERDCQEIDTNEKEKIRRGQGISDAIKAGLINKLTPVLGQHEPEPAPVENNLFLKFHLVNTMFRNMRPQPPVAAGRVNELRL